LIPITVFVALFRSQPTAPANRQSLPDFVQMENELRSHRNLTLLLLWQEYHTANAEGYSYSRFCVLYRRWKRKQDVVLRQDHKAGEKLFVYFLLLRETWLEEVHSRSGFTLTFLRPLRSSC